MAIRPDQNNLDEFVQLPAGIIPANLNTEFWIARQNDILGGFQQFADLTSFLEFSSNKMQAGMSGVVVQHTRNNVVIPTKIYNLKVIPQVSETPLSTNPDDTNFYLNFWEIEQEFDISEIATVYEYAPDINGLKPPFPYIDNPDAEQFWTTTYTPGESKWLRSRNTNKQFDGTSIYENWTIPLPIAGNFESGDFVANLFIRAASVPPLPPSTIDGVSNDNPEGWSDIPPVGTDDLYEIRAQKNKYGTLKTEWIGPFLIPENADLIRYNANATPDPNTLAGQNEIATEGSTIDDDLIAGGWVTSFNPEIHKYRASRTEISPGVYTSWDIVKIANESGEYIDRIYKLFNINADFDSSTFITNNTPIGNNPIENTQGVTRNEGWSDVQQTETDTTINGYSEARKFIDGSLKTPWSAPKPFTGKDTYIDYIRSNGETSFKYTSSEDTTPDPATITLDFFLFKGNNEITSGLTYQWTKIYDNRNVVNVDLGTNRTQVVSPSDVSGKAIFRCTATLAVEGGDDIVFIEEEPIVDITDGDDAKSLSLTTDTPIVLYDSSTSSFSVETIRLRAFQSFLTGTTFYWYKDDGAGNWVALAGNTDYTLTNQSLLITTSDLFTADGTKENARFAISTSANINDVENVDEFYDTFTIAKLSSTGVGAAGQDAYTVVLSNEVDSAILDRATGLPQSGEITSSGTVSTLINLYDGTTKLVAGTDYTIAVASNQANIAFDFVDEGDNYKVFVDTWTATTVRKVTCTVTINIVGVTEPLVKNFTITTNLDDAGAIIPFIQVASDSTNQTLSFTTQNSGNIKLEAVLDQNGTKIPASDFGGLVVWYYDNSNAGTTNTSGETNIREFKEITRAEVIGSLNVKAEISYNGNTYTTTPVRIDDITDAKQYIAYHRYTTVPTSEPFAIPTKPNDISISAFGSATGELSNSFFKTANINTYWYSLGTVQEGTNNIVWGTPIRNRGERGEQGPTPDFLVTMFKANNTGTTPTVPSSNASRTAMLNDGWFFTAQETTGDILYSASNTFNGEDLDTLGAAANANWEVIRVSGLVGPKGDSGEIQTYYAGNNNGNTGTYKYIRIAFVNLSSASDRLLLTLGINSTNFGGSGVLTINLRNTPNSVGYLEGNFLETLTGDTEYYLRNDSELWLGIKTDNPADIYYSVLNVYDASNSITFYENSNSSVDVAPSNLQLINKVDINNIDSFPPNYVVDFEVAPFGGNSANYNTTWYIQKSGESNGSTNFTLYPVIKDFDVTLRNNRYLDIDRNEGQKTLDLNNVISQALPNTPDIQNINNTFTVSNTENTTFFRDTFNPVVLTNNTAFTKTAMVYGSFSVRRKDGGDLVVDFRIRKSSSEFGTYTSFTSNRYVCRGTNYQQLTLTGFITLNPGETVYLKSEVDQVAGNAIVYYSTSEPEVAAALTY